MLIGIVIAIDATTKVALELVEVVLVFVLGFREVVIELGGLSNF